MRIKTYNGIEFDASGEEYFKYYTPQGIVNGGLFVMKEKFDEGYAGFVINYQFDVGSPVQVAYFTRDTIEQYGTEHLINGKFGNKPFIRISLAQKDGDGID